MAAARPTGWTFVALVTTSTTMNTSVLEVAVGRLARRGASRPWRGASCRPIPSARSPLLEPSARFGERADQSHFQAVRRLSSRPGLMRSSRAASSAARIRWVRELGWDLARLEDVGAFEVAAFARPEPGDHHVGVGGSVPSAGCSSARLQT